MALNKFDIIRTQDLAPSESSIRNSYMSYVNSNQINVAQALISNNPSLKSKIMSPESTAQLAHGINTLQGYYKEDVTDYLLNLINLFQINIDNFKVFTWSNTRQFEVGNFVYFENEVYLCVSRTIGNEPTNDEYWFLIGLRGEAGAIGLGVLYSGVWSVTANYNIKDMVVYANSLYVSKTSNINKPPNINTTDWHLALSSVKNRGILTGLAEPIGINVGNIWWQYIIPSITIPEIIYTGEIYSGESIGVI